MCLITEQKTPFIAKEDIKVYKLMESDLYSYFQYFKYEIGKLFETEIKESTNKAWNSCCELDKNYLIKKYKCKFKELKFNTNLACFSEGFHSAKSLDVCKGILDEFDDEDDCFFYEATIPKGAEYYRDGVGFIISNKLIINKEIK